MDWWKMTEQARELTQKKFKELIDYDAENGVFTWRVSPNGRVKIGDEAGSKDRGTNTYYRRICISGNRYFAHRLVWLYVYGSWPKTEIDHIDGNGMNNRIENLRDVTRAENFRNARRSKMNTSGVTGVFWESADKVWRARIKVNSKSINLGSFKSIGDAIAARKAGEKQYDFHPNHGEVRHK